MFELLRHYFLKNLRFIFRFILVGCTTFCLNIFLTWIFYSRLNYDYKIAISFSYILTVAAHFLLNKFFTFNGIENNISGDGIRYLFMLIINYLITLAVSIVVVGILGFSPFISIPISTIFVAASSFLLMRHFVFVVRGSLK
jgi:putative flippase GtrA